MEVILREHVDHLGKRGEIVKVSDGYARNYLLPRKLALLATDGNKKHVERERKIMETRESEEKGQAEGIATRLTAIDIVIARRVGDTPHRRVVRAGADQFEAFDRGIVVGEIRFGAAGDLSYYAVARRNLHGSRRFQGRCRHREHFRGFPPRSTGPPVV